MWGREPPRAPAKDPRARRQSSPHVCPPTPVTCDKTNTSSSVVCSYLSEPFGVPCHAMPCRTIPRHATRRDEPCDLLVAATSAACHLTFLANADQHRDGTKPRASPARRRDDAAKGCGASRTHVHAHVHVHGHARARAQGRVHRTDRQTDRPAMIDSVTSQVANQLFVHVHVEIHHCLAT